MGMLPRVPPAATTPLLYVTPDCVQVKGDALRPSIEEVVEVHCQKQSDQHAETRGGDEQQSLGQQGADGQEDIQRRYDGDDHHRKAHQGCYSHSTDGPPSIPSKGDIEGQGEQIHRVREALNVPHALVSVVEAQVGGEEQLPEVPEVVLRIGKGPLPQRRHQQHVVLHDGPAVEEGV